MVKSPRHGIADDIPRDKKISRKAHPADDAQLMPDTIQRFHVPFPVAILHAIQRQLFKKHLVIIHIAREAPFVLALPEVEADAAILQ